MSKCEAAVRNGAEPKVSNKGAKPSPKPKELKNGRRGELGEGQAEDCSTPWGGSPGHEYWGLTFLPELLWVPPTGQT